MTSDELAPAEQQFLVAERKVELDSAALKKERRLVDLVGIQILNIVGLYWVGTTGKLGSSHVMFWIPGVLLFYIPSGIVVAHLVKEMPLEGGLYQWAKLRFSPALGFLVAMNIWFFYLLLVCKTGVIVASNAASTGGFLPWRLTLTEYRPVHPILTPRPAEVRPMSPSSPERAPWSR